MSDDDDEEEEEEEEEEVTDSDAWLSAALDHGCAMQMSIEHHEERQRLVVVGIYSVVLVCEASSAHYGLPSAHSLSLTRVRPPHWHPFSFPRPGHAR